MPIQTHYERRDNPHKVSISQIELDYISNYKLSNEKETKEFSNNTYLNGKYIKELINQVAIEKKLIDNHLNPIEIPGFDYLPVPSVSHGIFEPEISYPTTWVKGDYSKDKFLGMVNQDEFITPLELSQKVGLLNGNSVSLNDDAHWFHFRLDGLNSFNHTLFLAAKPIRYNVSYDQLAQLGLVSDDNSTQGYKKIVINDRVYSVRLLKGANINNDEIIISDDSESSYGSEWNRLMYRLCLDNPGSQQGNNFAGFTIEGLFREHNDLYGSNIWMQERSSQEPYKRLMRGGDSISDMKLTPSDEEDVLNGWLPVLVPVVQ